MDRIYCIDDDGTPRHAIERGSALYLLEGDLFGQYQPGRQIVGTDVPEEQRRSFRVLAPIRPSKIVAVGLNYRDHAAERKAPIPSEPIIFLKPSTAVIGPGEAIRIPPGVGRVDHEAELAVVIGKTARNVTREQAADHVLGLTCANDVTARDLQDRRVQYSHCKGFDTFAPLGPCISVGLDPSALEITARVNGELRQSSNTCQLLFDVNWLVAYISSIMTLLPGDVISTGTPSGIGPLAPGDRVTISVAGIGDLVNPVAPG
jgi:2-keto-4-pentenoate hydratase/2-oxohepta-3-ene-1,7-dioic acid hydratase in catechol pathway